MISFQSIHCIGDRANQVILDIYQDILTQSEGNVSEWRPRIEHAQVFAPNDLKRIGELGGWYFLDKSTKLCLKMYVFSSDCERTANACVRYFDIISISNCLIGTQNI